MVGGGASPRIIVMCGKGALGNTDFNLAKLGSGFRPSNGPGFIRRDLFSFSLSYWMCKHFLSILFN